MGLDLVRGEGFWEGGPDVVAEPPECGLARLDKLGLAREDGHGAVMEGPEEGVLEAGPEGVGGAHGVREGMEREDGEVLRGLDLACKGGDDGGVVEVAALGDLDHEEVELDGAPEGVGGGGVELEAARDGLGEATANDLVAAEVEGLAGVVEEEGEVKDEGTFEGAEEVRVLGLGRDLASQTALSFSKQLRVCSSTAYWW